MEVIINTPLNSFNLRQGDIVLTSDKSMLVSTININDYKLALVDLANANVVQLLENGENMTHINDSIILKVVNNKEAKLILP